MSISDNYVPIKTLGNGSTTEFTGNWKVLNSSYIRVFLESVSTGIQTLKTLGSDYSLTFDDTGFVVTFFSAPTSANYVVIAREVSQDQSAPYKTSKGFQGEAIETSLDKLTAITQDLQDQVSRTPQSPIGSGALTLPVYSAGVIPYWSDDTANTQVNSTVTMEDIEGAVVAVSALAAASGVKVSSNDTTVGFLNGKLVAGTGLSFTENNDGGSETLTVNMTSPVSVANGGTGASTEANARTNLSVYSKAETDALVAGSIFHLADEKASGTAGGTSIATTWTKHTLAEKTNGITGSSVASSVVTLPAGTFRASGFAVAYQPNAFKMRLRNTTDSTTIAVGSNGYSSTSNNDNVYSFVDAVFTLASSKTIEFQYYIGNAVVTNGLGIAASSGEVEVYADLKFEKVG